MIELNKNEKGLRPNRLEAEKSKIASEMLRILRPSLRRLSLKKKMGPELQEDVEQHAYIGICKALEDYNPELSSFSTYVHWKIRAELQTMQHFQFPERRRLSTPVRISFVELDKPQMQENGDTCCMIDFLEDAHAEDKIEDAARKYVAFHAIDRIFSHSIARQVRHMYMTGNDDSKITAKVHRFMRDRWMYVRHTIFMENHEQIAAEYGISRERVRQIISKVEENVCHQVAHYNKSKELVDWSGEIPKEIHPSWTYMVLEYYRETGQDVRLVGRDEPMPKTAEAFDFVADLTEEKKSIAPVVAVEDVVDQPAVAETNSTVVRIDIPLSGQKQKSGGETGKVISMSAHKKALARHAASMVAAGAMLASAVSANAQTSRAIPPLEIESKSASVKVEAIKRKIASKPVVEKRRVLSLVSIEGIKVKTPSWGVKTAQFANLSQAREGWVREQNSWNWLKGLQPAYLKNPATNYHSIAFGPLTKDQADGMCHEAKRYGKPCEVISFGASLSKEA
jgi:RNA polymerase sigma factor (sigma-70 family)